MNKMSNEAIATQTQIIFFDGTIFNVDADTQEYLKKISGFFIKTAKSPIDLSEDKITYKKFKCYILDPDVVVTVNNFDEALKIGRFFEIESLLKKCLLVNYESIIERGEKLERIIERSEELEKQSRNFMEEFQKMESSHCTLF